MKSKLALILGVKLFVLLTYCANAAADIYSYKDELGTAHFSNMPNLDPRYKLVRRVPQGAEWEEISTGGATSLYVNSNTIEQQGAYKTAVFYLGFIPTRKLSKAPFVEYSTQLNRYYFDCASETIGVGQLQYHFAGKPVHTISSRVAASGMRAVAQFEFGTSMLTRVCGGRAQPKTSREKVIIQVDDTTMQVVGVPKEHKDKDGIAPGWVVAIEARDKSGKLVSRGNVAVTGCEPNKLGPKLGRMFILNGKTHYWTPSGDRAFDMLAKAVCGTIKKE